MHVAFAAVAVSAEFTAIAAGAALMHVVFAEGLADWDYLRRYSDVPDELAAHVATKSPAWAAAITGLDEEEILAFARLYGTTERSFIRPGYGFTRSRNGAANFHAVTCLPTVTGYWRHRGGGAFFSNLKGQTSAPSPRKPNAEVKLMRPKVVPSPKSRYSLGPHNKYQRIPNNTKNTEQTKQYKQITHTNTNMTPLRKDPKQLDTFKKRTGLPEIQQRIETKS